MPLPRQTIGWVLPTVGRKVPRSWRCHQAAADFSKVSPSPNRRHFLESWVVINELLISHDQVQVSIIDIFLSLQQFSMRC